MNHHDTSGSKSNAVAGADDSVPEITLSAAEALQIGLKLHQGGSLPEAETIYRRILNNEPANINALHFLAMLCHSLDRSEEAVSLIDQIVELDPENADARNNLGNVLEGLGKTAEAEACYRKAIEIHSGHGPAHNNLGVILMSGGRTEEALESYRRAVEYSPESPEFCFNMANAFRKSGKLKEAADAYRQAVDLQPGYTPAWQGLTRSLASSGRLKETEQAFEEWLRLDPGNPIVLYLQTAILGGKMPERAPDEYVRDLFDDMANRFDNHLVKLLEYRVPELLLQALATALPPPTASLDILDAGCGTGLCGPLLRPYACQLTGVDLSSGMLSRAAGLKQYDALVEAEITGYLSGQPTAFDVIACGDTLCYFGELEAVISSAAGALKEGGIFAFTLEDSADEAQDIRLADSGRYAHSRGYIERILEVAGLSISAYASVTLRNEGKQPVAGHLLVVSR